MGDARRLEMPIETPVPRGSKRVVEVCAAAWMDLLGYGAMLRLAGFDPTAPAAQAAVTRLDKFHELVRAASSKFALSLVLNDGAALHRDLSPRARSVTYDFVQRVFRLHSEVNRLEHSFGLPGARTVIGAGFRIGRHHGTQQRLINGIGRELVARVADGSMSAKQAILTAAVARGDSGSLPEFQANFAFTRAYLADNDGSSAGLGGPRFFIDLALFQADPPAWLRLDQTVDWSTGGMSARFGVVSLIDRKLASSVKFAGVLDAIEVARRLSGQGIVERLKDTRIHRYRKDA